MLSFLIFLHCKRNTDCSLLESHFRTANVEVRQRSDSIHKYQIPQQIQLSGVSWPQTFHPAAVSVEESIYVCSEIIWEVTKSTQQLETRATTFNKGHKDWRTSHTNHCHSKWGRNDNLAGTQASISRLRSLCLHMLWIPSPLFLVPRAEHRRTLTLETQCKEALAYNNHCPRAAAPERSKGQCEDSSLRALNKEDGALSSTSSALAWFSACCSASSYPSTLPTVPHHYAETLQLMFHYIYKCHCSMLLSLVNIPYARAPWHCFLPLLSLLNSIHWPLPSSFLHSYLLRTMLMFFSSFS